MAVTAPDAKIVKNWIELVFASTFIALAIGLTLYAISLDSKLLTDRFDILFGILIGFIGGAGIMFGLTQGNNK